MSFWNPSYKKTTGWSDDQLKLQHDTIGSYYNNGTLDTRGDVDTRYKATQDLLSGYNPTTRDATKINFDEGYFNNYVAVPLERQREEAMNQAREATPLYSSRARKEINDVNTKYAQDLLGARSNMQYQTDLQNAQFADQASRDNMAAQNEFANKRIQYNMGLDQMKDAYLQNRMAQIQALLAQTPYQTQDTMSGIQKLFASAGLYKTLAG